MKKIGLTENELKELFQKKSLESFMNFMKGQTVSVREDGESIFHYWDILTFIQKNDYRKL